MVIKYFKKLIILIVVLVLAWLVLWLYLADFGKSQPAEFGITFSRKYTDELGLDWRETLTAFLDDLKIRKFRLVAYWDLIEKDRGVYDFSYLDKQLDEIAKRGGEVIMTIGHRVPRWPECHWPNWMYQYGQEEREKYTLALLEATVNYFKNREIITQWQVENEPFLTFFGKCPRPDKDFYQREIELVRSLDNRPVVVTESGELSTWLKGAGLGDEVGVSVYRITWNNLIGYFYYPWPPAYYHLKSRLIKLFTGFDKIFVSELQMEPWLPMPMLLTSFDDQRKSMNPEIFNKNISYIKRTGLSPVYLWGAEWWYWLKKQGDDGIWNEAGKIWLNN
ncbi:MAG TPA: beta-galactosidase [Patescibacteria group bacterium]|nr:beta-galactosidase [Patescibacteria group bacterium]